MKKFITGVLVIVWMAVIFAFSAQDATESSRTSQSVSYRIAKWQDRFFHQGKRRKNSCSRRKGCSLSSAKAPI